MHNHTCRSHHGNQEEACGFIYDLRAVVAYCQVQYSKYDVALVWFLITPHLQTACPPRTRVRPCSVAPLKRIADRARIPRVQRKLAPLSGARYSGSQHGPSDLGLRTLAPPGRWLFLKCSRDTKHKRRELASHSRFFTRVQAGTTFETRKRQPKKYRAAHTSKWPRRMNRMRAPPVGY